MRAGDRIVGLASPGLRCNGYSLARAALLERGGRALDGPAWAGAHHDLAEELLRPSVIYAPAMLRMVREADIHAFAHVTGGGIPGNLVRVLPDRCDAVVSNGFVGESHESFARSNTPARSTPGRWNTCSTSVWECSRWSPPTTR